MAIDALSEFISQSFDDQRLSRGEASVFRQLIDDAKPNAHQRALLRNHIFTSAAQVIRHPESREALDWIADLIKIIDAINTPREEPINEVLFFPSDAGLSRLLNLLKETRKTLDICVFTITDNRISGAISDAYERGVKVRLITDNDKAEDRGSDIYRLSEEGIPVAIDNEPDHMHHKFALIDNRILLNGSFNWTRSASARNFENLTITSQPDLLRAFSIEFEKLWAQFRGAA